jgi:hypothetical protein
MQDNWSLAIELKVRMADPNLQENVAEAVKAFVRCDLVD